MTRCLVCRARSSTTSEALGVCAACLRAGSKKSLELAVQAHARPRGEVGLPSVAPANPATTPCELCVNACRPGDGEPGLCGTREAVGSRVVARVGTAKAAAVTFWRDAVPTNCSASWVCPAGSACGYPDYSYAPGIEHGYRNLAVGYYGCTFDCLYCQSWQTRSIEGGPRHRADEVAAQVDDQTACICFFGGDPTPQLAHAVATARLARRRAKAQRRHLRLCFETNGAMSPKLLRTVADLALESGGVIKVDLKAWHPGVHQALCGAAAERTRENFAYLAGRRKERPGVPLVVATTLLVPGYVDVEEVRPIAGFVAALGKDIPYGLLAFFPTFYLSDLPATSEQQAERCLAVARAAGLARLHLGGRELLREEAPAPAVAPRTRRRKPASALARTRRAAR